MKQDTLNIAYKFDRYGCGFVSGRVTLYIAVVIFALNMFMNPAQAFFFIYPVIYGVAFSNSTLIRTPKERIQIFMGFTFILMISVFFFTVFANLALILIIYTGLFTYWLLKHTSNPKYAIYTSTIGVALTVGIVLTQRGGTGSLQVALNREVTIFVMSMVVMIAYFMRPKTYYYSMYRRTYLSLLEHIYLYDQNKNNQQYENFLYDLTALESTLKFIKGDRYYPLFLAFLNETKEVLSALLAHDNTEYQTMVKNFILTQSIHIKQKKPILSRFNHPELQQTICTWNQLCLII